MPADPVRRHQDDRGVAVPDLGVRAGAGPGQEAEGGVRARTQVGRSIPAGSAAREGLIPRGVGPSSF